MLTTEMRAGKPRLEAFKNFAERTRVDDVRALVAMLVQTDRFGTSIAQALRTHAETSRTKRRQGAEERAAKLGVKLVFPLVFCLFPAFYVVVLGPAISVPARVHPGHCGEVTAPQSGGSMSLNTLLLIGAGIFLVLYLIRRRQRMSRED